MYIILVLNTKCKGKIFMDMLINGAVWLLNAYSLMILACVIIRWIPELQHNKIAEILSRIVDPFLAMFRRVIPPIGGLDLSAMIAMVLLQMAASGLARW